MLGAIIGDVIGSRFEGRYKKSIDFTLFNDKSIFTDDSVLTVACADCLLNNKTYVNAFQKYGRKYPNAGYGANFYEWIFSDNPQPYNSWGNGSAMRVSPVAYAFNDLEEVLEEAKKSAEVTHNHPEGIKGAQAIATSVYLARNKKTKSELKDYIQAKFGYDLERKLDDIRPKYRFDVSCQGSVPEAIIAFLESTDFESSIRLAISIGGDSDTIAAMAGSIAEAFYTEMPANIIKETKKRLPNEFLAIIEQFKERF